MDKEEKRKTQNKYTSVKLVYRHYVTQKLAKHFCTSKDELKESTEMEPDVLYYPLLDEVGFYRLIYAGHYSKVVLSNLWDGKKFVKSGLYESIVEAENLVPSKRTNDIIVALHLDGGRIWFVYRADSYEGLGGIFVQTEEGGFIIEPMEHYLKYNYPPLEE